MNKVFSLSILTAVFFLCSFISDENVSPKLDKLQDSISAFVDVRCKNDTCRLLDRSARREVFYKKLNDGRVIVIFDFWRSVTVLHESKGQWTFVDKIEWDFVSAFVEFKQFNNDQYDDLVIYGELDEYGNSKSYVYLYNPEHEHIEHFPNYDLINFDYDIDLDIYKSAHYGGYHKEAYQSVYKLENDSLSLKTHLTRQGGQAVTIDYSNGLADTTTSADSDVIWKTFAGTTWYY